MYARNMRRVVGSIGALSAVACSRPVCRSSCRVIIKNAAAAADRPHTVAPPHRYTDAVAHAGRGTRTTDRPPTSSGHDVYCSPTSIIQPPPPAAHRPTRPRRPVMKSRTYANGDKQTLPDTRCTTVFKDIPSTRFKRRQLFNYTHESL